MKYWVGVTDNDWFRLLRTRAPNEVNFWQPSGRAPFRSLGEGTPFLFKLHSPHNFIAGGGFFVSFSALPASVAWNAFELNNGVRDFDTLLTRLRKYRTNTNSLDPVIGCNVLAWPFFWEEEDWIPVPEDWAKNIVVGKTYDTENQIGSRVWQSVSERLEPNVRDADVAARAVGEEQQRYGREFLQRARLGQGAFRVLVTDAYNRRCAITGERTLPVLEAAHIKPFAISGPNRIENGLLLRSDVHKLFDLGYLTVTSELKVEVSRRIKEEYENGRDYYAHHGHHLAIVPQQNASRPALDYLQWHNENVFRS